MDIFKKFKPNQNKEQIVKFSRSLDANISMLKNLFSEDDTLIIRKFQNETAKGISFCIAYFEGMIDQEIIYESIIGPIQQADGLDRFSGKSLWY